MKDIVFHTCDEDTKIVVSVDGEFPIEPNKVNKVVEILNQHTEEIEKWINND
jgi:hypothetical protein